MASNQVLVPNLNGKLLLILATIVVGFIGLFEQRTKIVLKDGTVVSGEVTSRTADALTLVKASGHEERIPLANVEKETWLNFEVDLALGLDLKGGTTLRYGIQPSADDKSDPKATLDSTIAVFNQRLNNLGVKEITIVPSYEANEIVIELPGVTMEESDAYERVIQSLGLLEFRIVQDRSTPDGLNYEREHDRLKKYLDEHPGWTTKSIDLTQFDVKGRGKIVYRWFPWQQGSIDEGVVSPDFPFSLLEIDPDNSITGRDLEGTRPAQDQRGRSAVGFVIKAERAADFGDFTGSHEGRQMAIVLDGEIKSAPNLKSRIEREGIIEGGSNGFTQAEEKELRTVLSSGSLQVKPIRLSKATIGPTLGEASIRRSMISGVIAVLLVLGFIVFYYPGIVGLVTCLTLVLGIFLLVGGLGFLGATITLPGIAGIILTVGMAVDQNILILERIREEREKGKTMFQSMKNGFERAFVTIFDSQATTFLAGFILYHFGTGPIRGFAVTLMLGIVTTMFAAILGSKVMFAYGLERGWFEKLKFRNPLGKLNIRWMNFQKIGFVVSIALTIVGMAAFFMGYEKMKGLDFAGGFQAHVRLKDPMPPAELDRLVHNRFPSAQVVALRAVEGGSADDQGGTEYLIRIRADLEATSDDAGLVYQTGLIETIGSRLLPQGIDIVKVESETDGPRTNAEFNLNFDAPIAQSVVEGRLKDKLALDSIAPAGGSSAAAPVASYHVLGSFPVKRTPEQARAEVSSALTNLPGNVRLSDPIPESQFIGSKVGKELANNAIIAVILATIGILIYIRVRFRDVNWGIGACLAGAHDTVLGLGLVSICASLGMLNIELDLTMIGAFLTLIGYSLNDTIVIFDRIRENIPRMDKPLREVIDESINETMSRTLLTGGSTFLAVFVLFVMNIGHNNVIEGFGFVMWTGVIIGTYSSIFVASPVLLWLTERDERKRNGGQDGAKRPAKPQAAAT